MRDCYGVEVETISRGRLRAVFVPATIKRDLLVPRMDREGDDDGMGTGLFDYD